MQIGKRQSGCWEIGGTINTDAGTYDSVGDLPDDPFRLTAIGLRRNAKVTDEGFGNLNLLPYLIELRLDDTNVGDAGLAHLPRVAPNLESLIVGSATTNQPQITNAGINHIKKLEKLTFLSLDHAHVDDAGIKQLQALQKLESLGLKSTNVTDVGIVHLKKIPTIKVLSIDGTTVGDAGLEHLKGLELTALNARSTKITDAGLKHLTTTQLPYLRLRLSGTGVSDAGLEHIKAIKTRIVEIELNDTKVSADGVKALQKALPNCKVIHESIPSSDDAGAAAADGNYGLRFEKGNVTIPSLHFDVSQPLTVEAFVVPFADKTEMSIIGDRTMHGVYLGTSPGTWKFVPSRYLLKSEKKEQLPLGRKSHIAGVLDKGEARFFVDGKLVTRRLVDKSWSELIQTGTEGKANRITIGGGVGQVGSFDGIIDEVRISKTARYRQDFVPAKRFTPDDQTIALYHFDEGFSDAVRDASGNGHHGKLIVATWVKESADGKYVPHDASAITPKPEEGSKLEGSKRLESTRTLESKKKLDSSQRLDEE